MKKEDNWDFWFIMIVVPCSVLLGVLMATFIFENGSDSIFISTLDDVCVELYGDGSFYEDQGISQKEFVCVKYQHQNIVNQDDSSVRLELR